MIVKNRIKKHSEFQKVIAEGEVERTNLFVFYSLSNELGYTRIGISVPKKTGTAVLRNKVKRQIRSAIASSTDYTKSLDLVIVVRKGYDAENFELTKKEIQEKLKK